MEEYLVNFNFRWKAIFIHFRGFCPQISIQHQKNDSLDEFLEMEHGLERAEWRGIGKWNDEKGTEERRQKEKDARWGKKIGW